MSLTSICRLEGKAEKKTSRAPITKSKKEPKEKRPKSPATGWDTIRQAELRQLLKKNELKQHGTKLELIRRLKDANVDMPTPAPTPAPTKAAD
jgi:hypothetical protein